MTLEIFVGILSFLGAWLLFLGPMQQAALELREEDEARDKLHELHDKNPPYSRVSSWWWLLPPVKLILENKERDKYKQKLRDDLSEYDFDVLVTYMSKARAWVFVGLGGLMISISETVGLVDEAHWSRSLVLPIVLLLTFASLASVVRVGRQGRR